MKIFGLGLPELIVILIVALLIFGPKNLPKLGSAVGKTVKNLRDGFDGKNEITASAEEESEEEEEEEEVEEAPKKAAPKKKTTSTTKTAAKKK
jgi:sec-independent protein translocase protein TatA